MPEVSIIIPVYNKVEYLENTVRLLTDPCAIDSELIIIDDGSDDGSGELANCLANRFEQCEIRVIHQENQGVSVARNRGLDIARGKWVWFVDADDIPDIKFVEKVIEQSKKETFDIFMGNFEKVSADGQVAISCPEVGIALQAELADCFVKMQPQTGYFGYLWNKVIRREVIKKNNITFKQGLTLAEDLDFMISVYQHVERVYFSQYCAIKYQVDTVNSSREKKIDYEAQLKIQIKIRNWFCEIGKEQQYSQFLKTNITKYAAYVLYYSNEDGVSVVEQAKKLLSNPDVRESLIKWNASGVMGKLAHYLKKRQFRRMQIYLASRNLMRKIYRIGGGTKCQKN